MGNPKIFFPKMTKWLTVNRSATPRPDSSMHFSLAFVSFLKDSRQANYITQHGEGKHGLPAPREMSEGFSADTLEGSAALASPIPPTPVQPICFPLATLFICHLAAGTMAAFKGDSV